jgi:hypothetical protein
MSEFATNAIADNKTESMNSASVCPAIIEDHAFIKEDLPKAAILTLTQQFVTVIIMRTPYSRVQLRIQVINNMNVEECISTIRNFLITRFCRLISPK